MNRHIKQTIQAMNTIQFEENIGQTLGGLVLAIGMGLGAVGNADAGAITGNFDPAFGPALPGWNYSGTFTLDFSDEWTSASYGSFQQVVDVDHRKLTLAAFGQNRQLASSVCISQLVGDCTTNTSLASAQVVSITYNINTGLLTDWVTTTDLVTQTLAELNGINFGAIPPVGGPRTFNFSWDSLLAGPTLVCAGCVVGAGPVSASLDGLIVTYQQVSDDFDYVKVEPAPPKVVGDTVSTYAVNPDGSVTRSTVVILPGAGPNPVPEPGSMALVLAALMGAGWVRRRQA